MIVAFGPAPQRRVSELSHCFIIAWSVQLVLCASRHDSKELNTLHSTESNDHMQTRENFGSMACYGYALYNERTSISSIRRPLTARGDRRQDGAQLCAL